MPDGQLSPALHQEGDVQRDETEGQEEARELSKENYGRDEWWLLLDPIEGASS